MKIGFINAVFTNKLDSFPIGLVSLCTVLQEKGISAKIVDFTKLDVNDIIRSEGFSNNYIDRCAEIICSEGFCLVSFYTMANSYHISIKIAEKVKMIDPNCIVIFAGPQASVCGEDTLRCFSFIDIVVVIDEFADLADQLETKKEQNAFYKPVQRIAQTGRSRGIHLVICTQRPEAKLVPSTTKAQLNGRVALRVNDGISSRMIIEVPDAQYLQKHGDMIYRNGDVIERAQGYLIEIPELDEIVSNVIKKKS